MKYSGVEQKHHTNRIRSHYIKPINRVCMNKTTECLCISIPEKQKYEMTEVKRY